ncbi:hypothetical protein ACFVHB_20095 [Kitasatospora sp. NPDC127111]|uniref:hypothetical protein n=1 Tax=Kitasatospora sp. NPDC127111 TaxID=3345363 RepID=UPI00362BED51
MVSRDTLAEGAEATLTALMHDAAHLLNWVNQVSDTTRRGSYHNRRFADAAEVVGLSWPDGKLAPASSGFRDVVLSDQVRAYPETPKLLTELEAAITTTLPALAPRRESGKTRTRITAACACEQPRRITLTPSTLDRGMIICDVCRQPFKAAQD